MIDWIFVSLNAMWIVGLSLVLASLSMAFFIASDQNIKLSKVFERKGYTLMLYLGLTLSCIGIGCLVGAWWERFLWGFLALGSIASLWVDLHKRAAVIHG